MDLMILFQSITILLVVKVLVVILLVVYMIFAGLMMLQIRAMTKAITMKDDYVIRGLGVLHFGFAVLVFLISVFIL